MKRELLTLSLILTSYMVQAKDICILGIPGDKYQYPEKLEQQIKSNFTSLVVHNDDDDQTVMIYIKDEPTRNITFYAAQSGTYKLAVVDTRGKYCRKLEERRDYLSEELVVDDLGDCYEEGKGRKRGKRGDLIENDFELPKEKLDDYIAMYLETIVPYRLTVNKRVLEEKSQENKLPSIQIN